MDNARDPISRAAPGAAPPCTVAAVLLAAGASTRFGPENKLLAEISGEPLIARLVAVVLASRIGEIVVVTPADPSAIATALARAVNLDPNRLRIVANSDPSRGIASSIVMGIEAVSAGASGAMIVPADMPGLTVAACNALISAFAASGHAAVVHAATGEQRQRNPVIWPRRLFEKLLALSGDTGGKPLIAEERASRPASVIAVAFDRAELFLDVDVPADLARWR